MNGWGTYLINNYKSTKDNYFWQEFSRDTHGLNLLVAVNIFKSYHLCLTVHLFTEWDPHFWGLTRVATGYCNCYEQKNKEHRFINKLKMKVIFSFLLRESLIHRLISSRSEMVEGWEKVPCISLAAPISANQIGSTPDFTVQKMRPSVLLKEAINYFSWNGWELYSKRISRFLEKCWSKVGKFWGLLRLPPKCLQNSWGSSELTEGVYESARNHPEHGMGLSDRCLWVSFGKLSIVWRFGWFVLSSFGSHWRTPI